MFMLVLLAMIQHTGPRATVMVELSCLLVRLAGLTAGVVALFGIRKHGRNGILVPATVGILLNGLPLIIFATNFLPPEPKPGGSTRSRTA